MTLICHSKKFIFLKTRKTGGTALEMALQGFCAPGRNVRENTEYTETEHGIIGSRNYQEVSPPVNEHMSARRVQAYVGTDIWQSYAKISVVRNPYEKLVSEFFWQEQSASRLPETEQIAGFRNWVLSERRKWTTEDYKTLSINKKLVAQHIVRHENYSADAAKVAKDLDLGSLSISRFKSGFRPSKRQIHLYYNTDTIRFVEENFSFELSTFGYKFDDLFPKE